MYASERNDACSVTVNKVDQDSKSMPGSRCRSYGGETSVTFRSNITYAILFFSSWPRAVRAHIARMPIRSSRARAKQA